MIKTIVSDVLTRLRWSRSCRLGTGAKILRQGRIENIRRITDAVVLGNYSVLRGRLLTYGHGGNITIGDHCYVGERTEIWSAESICIGNRVLIAHDVNIHDSTAHSLDADERHDHFRDILTIGHPRECPNGFRSAPIVIEDDVWISFGVTILKGVKIGQSSVIAAKSIVTKDVPPFSLYRSEISPIITPLKTRADLR